MNLRLKLFREVYQFSAQSVLPEFTAFGRNSFQQLLGTAADPSYNVPNLFDLVSVSLILPVLQLCTINHFALVASLGLIINVNHQG